MKRIALYAAIILTIFFSGCSAPYTQPQMDMEPPKYVEQMPTREIRENYSNAGSLFGQGKNPLFADRKAMQEHDIVTVVIEERASSSSNAQRNVSKNNNSRLGGGVVNYGGESGAISDVVNEFNKIGSLGFETQSERSFNGGGTSTRNEQFTTTVSARIIKVMQNGNYFIQGSRELLIEGEKQVMLISGVIRPYDIDQNNQINSRYISDAKILYTTQGEIHKATQRGWANQIIESVWPF